MESMEAMEPMNTLPAGASQSAGSADVRRVPPTQAVQPVAPIDPARIARMRAVTLSRQYGSGGGEVAARLSRRLGWQLVDHEIVAEVAARLGLPLPEAEEFDERGESLIERLLAGMASVEPALPMTNPSATDDATYRETLRAVVESAAHAGHVVIVGRGGQVLLCGQRDILHVRIVAPLEDRIVYVM